MKSFPLSSTIFEHVSHQGHVLQLSVALRILFYICWEEASSRRPAMPYVSACRQNPPARRQHSAIFSCWSQNRAQNRRHPVLPTEKTVLQSQTRRLQRRDKHALSVILRLWMKGCCLRLIIGRHPDHADTRQQVHLRLRTMMMIIEYFQFTRMFVFVSNLRTTSLKYCSRAE